MQRRARNLALAGEFVNLADFLISVNNNDNDEFRTVVDERGNVSFRPTRNQRVITSSLRWLEAWSAYEVLMCSAYGLQVFQDMVAYRVFMIGLFIKYRFACVLSYDNRHRQNLGANRSLNFGKLNPDLYITTFDSNAIRGTGTRCTRCNGDHPLGECPFRGAGQGGDVPRVRRGGERNPERSERSSEICYQFQDNRCRAGTKCPRKHACMVCFGPEGFKSCPKCNKKPPPPS